MRQRTVDVDHRAIDQHYPCRRKHCSSCKRWRHVIDFLPRTRRSLQSKCETCMRLWTRKDRGFQPRKRGMTREERNARKRQQYAEKMAELRRDPHRLQEWREYKRMDATLRRRDLGVPERKFRVDRTQDTRTRLDATPFRQWLDQHLHELVLEESDYRVVLRVLGGERTVQLSTADRILSQHGEHHLVAVFWPLD